MYLKVENYCYLTIILFMYKYRYLYILVPGSWILDPGSEQSRVACTMFKPSRDIDLKGLKAGLPKLY